MAALQGIKRRIRSVTNTKQITKAMQLVAASKLRRAQEAAHGPEEYTLAAKAIMAQLAGESETRNNVLLQSRDLKRALTIIVAGDRGMAGAYNTNVIRTFARRARELDVSQDVIAVGRRAAITSSHFKDVTEIAAYEMDSNDPDTGLAKPILAEALELFRSGAVDRVEIVYTHFVSTIKQEAVVEQILPVIVDNEAGVSGELEPDPATLLEFAILRTLEAQILSAILESRASEQAGRMVAMLNATDNAGDIIEDLTLEYNNARQAAITQEIAEISSGTEAING